MVALNWVRGLIAHRPARLLATAIGVAVGVALIASIGTFLSSTNAKRTRRAISSRGRRLAGRGPTGRRPRAVLATVRRYPACGRRSGSLRHFTQPAARPPSGSTADHGEARVLGLPLRLRDGVPRGAASAHGKPQRRRSSPSRRRPTCTSQPGDTVTIALPGAKPAQVTVGGVVDLRTRTRCFRRSARRPGRS